MHVMAALEDADRLDRGEHVLGTDRAVAVEGVLEADMIIKDGEIDTASALCAVFVVNPKSLAHTAQAAVLAMEDRLVGVRKEMADVAVVLGELLPALFLSAVLGAGLDFEAVHTHHLFDGVAVNLVLLARIVTQPTRVEATTARSTDFGLPRVVRTAHDSLSLILVGTERGEIPPHVQQRRTTMAAGRVKGSAIIVAQGLT